MKLEDCRSCGVFFNLLAALEEEENVRAEMSGGDRRGSAVITSPLEDERSGDGRKLSRCGCCIHEDVGGGLWLSGAVDVIPRRSAQASDMRVDHVGVSSCDLCM